MTSSYLWQSPVGSRVAQFLEGLIDLLPQLILALVITLSAFVISAWLTRLVRGGLAHRRADQELTTLLTMLTRWGIIGFGVVVALSQVIPDVTGLIAGLGVVGFTIGFALQDVAKNFVAGVLLLIQQPFAIGESIEVSGFSGKVIGIGLRATELRTVDGRHVIIPNGDVMVSPIVNFTRSPQRRLELTFGVTYDSDLPLISRLSLEALQDVSGLLMEPAPSIVFSGFTDASLRFRALFWVDSSTVSLDQAQTAAVTALKARFDSAGVEVPSPPLVTMLPGQS
jgi:small conductance mechanosensitive channel